VQKIKLVEKLVYRKNELKNNHDFEFFDEKMVNENQFGETKKNQFGEIKKINLAKQKIHLAKQKNQFGETKKRVKQLGEIMKLVKNNLVKYSQFGEKIINLGNKIQFRDKN